MYDDLHRVRERVTRLETVIGDDGGGLRADLVEIKSDIRALFERVASSEKRFALMVGGGAVIVFIIDRVWK